MPVPKAKRKHASFDWSIWLLIILTFCTSFILFLKLLENPSADTSIHTVWAGECSFAEPRSFLHHVAHPMWHAIVVLFTLIGFPLEIASSLVTALCKTVEVYLIYKLIQNRCKACLSCVSVTVFTFICSMVSCLCVPFYNPTVYAGVGTPNTWHSCTQLIAMVFMFLCVPYTCKLYDTFYADLIRNGSQANISWKKGIMLGLLLFLSLLAKPTFMQAFLPACCLFFLYQWCKRPRNSSFFLRVILCITPAVLFMIVQYLYYFGIIVPHQSSMALQFSFAKFTDTLIRVLLMTAFPLYSIVMTRNQKKDTLYIITLLFFAVSVIEFLVLGETGRRAADGNFGWGMMGAALMLWSVCLTRFLNETSFSEWRSHICGWILLGWHLLSGIYYFLYLLFSTSHL